MDRGFERGQLLALKTVEANVSDVVASPTSTLPSSPASSEGDKRFSLHSIKSRARKSISGRDSTILSNTNRSHSPHSRSHSRRLSKSRPSSTTSITALTHRPSGLSDDSATSISDVSNDLTPSPSNIDWQTQRVEGVGALETDTQFLGRSKTPYLVVTSEYLVKLKGRSDAIDMFPSLSEKPASERGTTTPDPLVVIPLSSIVSVFVAESTRPSFGIEIWWRAPSGVSFCQASFFFNLPGERDEQMHNIVRAMGSTQHDDTDAAHTPAVVLNLLETIHESEEPGFKTRKLEVFPVVPRASMRKEYIKKVEDSSKKPHETPSFYLVVGTYLCYLAVVQKGKSGEPVCQHKTFGLVTLEKVRGGWAFHEERFNISFRHPLAPRDTLELSSRFYRRIIRVFGTADRYLKPAWPQMWQTAEIFQVMGLKEPQYIIPREDFGSVRRTLDAFLAAYRCHPVEWEINWKTKFPPEFRVLPAKNGSKYTFLQLLAVLRALKYNDYFHSISFRDVDLTPMWGVHDPYGSSQEHVAYMSRTCVTLNPSEVQVLQSSPVLYQEFHALAFCSETIQQIDFTNSTASLTSRGEGSGEATPCLGFLAPILNLLRSDITKCSNLILANNALLRADVDDIIETLNIGKIRSLDLSSCGLCERELRDLITPFLYQPHPLRSLNLSENPGRLPVGYLPQMLYNLPDLEKLNLRGALQGERDIIETLIPYDILDHLWYLEELDISGFKVNPETLQDLGVFIRDRALRAGSEGFSRFRRLGLNHCGLNGSQAARLCRAIGNDSSLHLSISGNPLEDGIEDLADAIRESSVPAGLYMEVVEFKETSNYLLLMRALADTTSVSLLSLAGTAPTPSFDTIHQPCMRELVETLECFFANNKSIRYLDLSGFSGKLEDGQLAQGFAHSLTGLSKNTTMTHLKIRNQNLHDDVGIIGKVLSENRTLRVLDCQDNQLNLTSIKFLVSSARDNDTIIDFPFAPAERAAIWRNILRGIRKTSLNDPSSTKRVALEKLKSGDEVMLRDALSRQFEELDGYLQRNRKLLEDASGRVLDLDLSAERLEDMEDAWLALGAWGTAPYGEQFGNGSENATSTAPDYPRRTTVRSSYVGMEMSAPAPYHTRHGDEGVESPNETLDPPELSTPPDMAVLDLEDSVFQKLIHEFQETGFDTAS